MVLRVGWKCIEKKGVKENIDFRKEWFCDILCTMESKKAAGVLIEMLKKYPLDPEETEAVRDAIGVLSWTMLAETRIKTLKRKPADR